MSKKLDKIQLELSKFDYFKLKSLAKELSLNSHNLDTEALRNYIIEQSNTNELHNHLKIGFRWKSWHNAILALLLFVIPYLSLCHNNKSIPVFTSQNKFNIVVAGFQNLSTTNNSSNSQLIYERLNSLIKNDSLNCEIRYQVNFPKIIDMSEEELDHTLQEHNINLLIYGFVDETCNTKEICINWHSNSNLNLDEYGRRSTLKSKFHTFTNDALLNGSLQEELEYIIYFFSALIANKSNNHDKVIEYVQEDIINRLGITTCMSRLLLADSYLEKSEYEKSIEILESCERICKKAKDLELSKVKAKVYSELELYHLFEYHSIKDIIDYFELTNNFQSTCEIFYNYLFINHKLELYHKNQILLDSFSNTFHNEISKSYENDIYLKRLKLINNAYIGYPVSVLDELLNIYINKRTPRNIKQLIIKDYFIICEANGLERKLNSFMEKYVYELLIDKEDHPESIYIKHDLAIDMLIEFIHNPKNDYSYIMDRWNEIKPVLFKDKYNRITESRVEYLIGSFKVSRENREKVELHYNRALKLLKENENTEILQATIYIHLVNIILHNTVTLRSVQTGGVIYLNENNLDQFPRLFEDYTQDSTSIFDYYSKIDTLLYGFDISNTHLEVLYNDSKAYAFSSFNNYSKANEFFLLNHDLLHKSELFRTILHSQNAYNFGSHLLTYNTEEGIKKIESAYMDRLQIVPENSSRLITPLTRLVEVYKISNDSVKVKEVSTKLYDIIQKRKITLGPM